MAIEPKPLLMRSIFSFRHVLCFSGQTRTILDLRRRRGKFADTGYHTSYWITVITVRCLAKQMEDWLLLVFVT
jgi:hypothetical protein